LRCPREAGTPPRGVPFNFLSDNRDGRFAGNPNTPTRGALLGIVMTFEQTATRYSPYVLSIVRIVVALLFFEHGLSRLFGWPSALPTPPVLTLYWFAGMIELCGGLLLGLGLCTRTAALIMSGEMALAYFLSHAPRNFFPILNGGDSAILYCFIFLYFAFAGPGPWNLDAVWQRRPERTSPATGRA
jgi:putative oxidoreductase